MAMPAEILVLALGCALLMLHIALQGIFATVELGSRWNASPRDERLQVKGPVAGRAERALRNYLETFPALVGLALALVVLGKTGGLGETGAWIWFLARLVYIPLYLGGIPYIRSLVWTVSALGLTLMFVALFL
jgi:uncharacterized MAPEG superfamily protein